MENLQHFINLMKLPPQPLLGQTVFYDASFADPIDISQYYHPDVLMTSKLKDDVNFQSGTTELQQVYGVCSAYAKELNFLSNAGLRMARCLTSLESADISGVTPSPQEMAGHFVKMWTRISINSKKYMTNFEDGALAALREAITNDTKEKSDTNKVLMACFLAVIQLHYQFSLTMFESSLQLFSSLPEESANSTSSPTQGSKSNSPENGLRDIPPEMITSWMNSIGEMQKHLAMFLNQQQHSKCNDSVLNPTVTPSKRRWSFGGMRHSSCGDWGPKPHQQWFVPRPQSDVDTGRLHAAWQYHDSSDDTMSLENKKTDSQKSSTFASNEELQDVISLLSCQPSNPSSPTSETPMCNASMNGQNSVWSSSLPTPTFMVESTERTWNNKSDIAEDSYGDLAQNLRLQPIFDMDKLSDMQSSHARATKTTSWPATTCSQEIKMQNGSNDRNPTGTRKEQGFFMGLELVGTDLMASVRQRRHSSGESLCKTSRLTSTPTSSTRTKSTDNITSEGNCPRTSTWPLKQVSPQSSGFFISNTDARTGDCGSANWASLAEYPQGLPPSGIECRNKNKGERKYSLFGNPT